jgi:D-alanyl-D-alanine carboxypeptidase
MTRYRVRVIDLPLMCTLLALGTQAATAQEPSPSARETLQQQLDQLRERAGVPGATAGLVLEDGTVIGLASGFADTATREPMEPGSLLLQGSVGKTYVAAVALQLVQEGRLDLDARVSAYLGGEPWFGQLPNHEDVTVRQLMNHTSGIVRYEFNERFIADLLAQPDKVWRPEEQIAYLFGSEPPFAAGAGWDYSDTNYLILGLIIERLTGATYYAEVRRRVLQPLSLTSTVPSDSRRIPGLVQGYGGPDSPFGPDEMLVDGVLAFNPQFEWTGGGMASTAEDLARWGKALYEGQAFDPALLPVMLDGVPARLGPNTRYGLGVIIRPTPLGESWGHSGYFPGYLTEMAYFPQHRLAVAVQVNSSDFRALRMSPAAMLLDLATAVTTAGSDR